MGFMLVGVLLSVAGMVISSRLQGKFRQYSQVPITSGLSGAEVAQTMLQHYGIHDVKVVQGQGFLSDHYNPVTKPVSLGPQVYQGRNVAAAAVAAHALHPVPAAGCLTRS